MEDPWSPVSGETIATLRGKPDAPAPAPPAPVSGAGRRLDTTSIEVSHHESDAARTGASTELLDLLTDGIAAAPRRTDLWMMRFEMFRSMGMKPEFQAALVDAWSLPGVRRVVDWNAIHALWESLAPGEAMPPGVTPVLSATTPAGQDVHQAASSEPTAAATHQGQRRFADVAMQVAGDELNALTRAYSTLRSQPGFYSAFARSLAPVLNRPSPLHYSDPLTRAFGGVARIYLKREDKLRQSPALGNAAAQAHLATALGKHLLITGNDVDGHCLALATIAPRFNLELRVLVRPDDLQAKGALVSRLRELGARVEPAAGESISNDPREAALRFWKGSQTEYHLGLSLGTGPRPYPTMASDFQSLLGRETVLQVRAQTGMTRPWSFVAAVFSEADSIGFMVPHLGVAEIPLYYAEPDRSSQSARSSTHGRAFHGHRREHAWLKASGRIGYGFIPDGQAQAAQEQVKALEGFDISLEDARAVVEAARLARAADKPRDIVVLVA